MVKEISRKWHFFKSIDGVLGIRTRGRKMEGADETTEIWRPAENGILQGIL